MCGVGAWTWTWLGKNLSVLQEHYATKNFFLFSFYFFFSFQHFLWAMSARLREKNVLIFILIES